MQFDLRMRGKRNRRAAPVRQPAGPGTHVSEWMIPIETTVFTLAHIRYSRLRLTMRRDVLPLYRRLLGAIGNALLIALLASPTVVGGAGAPAAAGSTLSGAATPPMAIPAVTPERP